MKTKSFDFLVCAAMLCSLCIWSELSAENSAGIWMKFEQDFTSTADYENPIYDVGKFYVSFTSPTGRVKNINGFWDGGRTWRVRFCPDEKGAWSYTSECSDSANSGLHRISGSFECVLHEDTLAIYARGAITRPKGTYYLTHADGTPFFWTACTAWNGALRSTEEEWEHYLADRASNGYNVIQFVTTQWRGCEADLHGRKAFEGSARIRIDPIFFHHLDGKIDRINAHGLVAAPVLLWALPWGQGRELSPGYYLPESEAILLARYMVARYGGNHVIWILGGDGAYVGPFEQRWKNIGRGVFGDEHPGLVAQHPHGQSWIGNDYADESWLDIIGYQSSHSNSEQTVSWINKGPVSQEWDRLPARPIINLEPNYEEIGFRITARDVRNACYWSVFAAPVAGITYGANGIWPWLRKGEKVLNHDRLLRDDREYHTWRESIEFDGSIQVGYLAQFFRSLEWWRLKPTKLLLAEQPGDNLYNSFISVAGTDNRDLVVAYIPVKSTVVLRNPSGLEYQGQWFDPVANRYSEAEIKAGQGLVQATSPGEEDMLLVLKKTGK